MLHCKDLLVSIIHRSPRLGSMPLKGVMNDAVIVCVLVACLTLLCPVHLLSEMYMWQSRIEIEYYSVAYFKHITKFDTL